WRGGKNERTRAIDEIISQHARPADVTARSAERLAQRPHLDFDAVRNTTFLSETAAVGTEQTRGMGLIHHQPCAVAVLEFNQFTQRGNIAIHGENALRDDQRARMALP